MTESKTAFKRLDASEEAIESGDLGLNEIESVCMNCYERGTTRLLLTRIPFYRDCIISSFSCDHCHMINTGVESANKIQDKGVKYRLEVKSPSDMNRRVVKSDYGIFQIPSIEFEIPPLTQKGYMTTVEGVLDRVITNLKADIEARKDVDKEVAEKLEAFMQKVSDLKELKSGAFEVVLDDPSGDSFVENPNAPGRDENMTVKFYKRNKEQNELLGLEEEEVEEKKEGDDGEYDPTNEIASFETNCSNCNALCQTNMKMTDIPFFKRVLIMCTTCDNCGVKSSEVKSGEGIEPKAVKFTLKLTDPSDLNRDVLKSDYATFEIPEIEFCMNEGTLGSKFTTLEGMLKDCVSQLREVTYFGSPDSGLYFGDSQEPKKKNKMEECIEKLESIQNGQMLNITVILDDPSGTSYLQNVYAPEEDPNLKVENYERTFEQNEQMGLNDMKTENYKEEEDDS